MSSSTYQQTRSLSDRDRAKQYGLKVPEGVKVAFLPKSGDPQEDFKTINTYYGEFFDSMEGGSTPDGQFMVRSIEAEQAREEFHRQQSKIGLHQVASPSFTGPEIQEEEEIEASGAESQGLIQNDPSSLSKAGFYQNVPPQEGD